MPWTGIEATCPRCLYQDVGEGFGVYECKFCGLIFRSKNIEKSGSSLNETAKKATIYIGGKESRAMRQAQAGSAGLRPDPVAHFLRAYSSESARGGLNETGHNIIKPGIGQRPR